MQTPDSTLAAMPVDSRSRTGNLLLMLPFLALFYAQIAHHQPWRDELNAWAVTCHSQTLSQLISGFHHDGHPGLWFFLLYPFSKLSQNVWMLKLVEAAIATGSYLLLALTTPLRRAEQVLVYLGSFVLFEYTVMSRMYSLLLLVTLIYLYGRIRTPHRLLLNVFWLGVLSNVDTMGALLSFTLLAEYLWATQITSRPIRWRALFAPAALYAAMLALFYVSLRPAKDMSWRSTGHIADKPHTASSLIRSVQSWLVLPFFPLDRYFPHHWWNVNATVHFLPHVLLLPVTVAALIFVARRQPSLQVLLGLTAAIGIVFSFLIYQGSVRHFGIMYLAFLAAVWILRARRQPVSHWAYVLFGLSALAGLAGCYGQWSRPFADDQQTAQWLTANGYADATLIGYPDTHIIGVPELLHKPIYQLDCRCTDTYLLWSTRRDDFDPDHQVPERLAEAVHTLAAPRMLFLTNAPLEAAQVSELTTRGIHADLLTSITRGDIDDEHFWIYRVH